MCPVWHHEMRDFYLKPQYHYQCDAYLALEPPTRDAADSASLAAAEQPEVIARVCRILVLFGSQTGTSESYARKTVKALAGHDVTLATMDEYGGSAKRRQQMAEFTHVLVITSTFGDGGPPFNATEFLTPASNLGPEVDLSDVQFAVLAVGSRAYSTFCAFGLLVDNALGEAGGSHLHAIMMADELKSPAATFAAWLAIMLGEIGPATGSSSAAGPRASTIQLRFSSSSGVGGSSSALRYQRIGAHSPLKVVSNEELLAKGDIERRSTRSIQLDVGISGVLYKTGDHIAIRPCNLAAEITRFLATLEGGSQLDLQAYTTAVEVDEQGAETPTQLCFPNGYTLRSILESHVCLRLDDGSAADLARLLEQAAEAAGHGAAAREYFSSTPPEELCELFVEVAELLELAAGRFGARLTLAQVLPALSPQKDRFYSISSSSRAEPKRITITVGVMHANTSRGAHRKGLCSYYLARLQPLDIVHGTVHHSRFRYPEDPGSPVICAAAGTGLAPFMGFLSEREVLAAEQQQQQQQMGPAMLYFGCRSRDEILHLKRLQGWKQSASPGQTPTLTHMSLALSRQPDVPKRYVQDLMCNSSDLAEALMSPRAHFYFCGDSVVADECYEALLKSLELFGHMTRMAAVHHIDVMRSEGRYLLDVWGLVRQDDNTRQQLLANAARGAQCWMTTFIGSSSANLFAPKELKRRATYGTETLLHKCFCEMDVDGNGTLDFDELRAALRAVLPGHTPEQISHYFSLIDKDGSGTVTFIEFRDGLMDLSLERQMLAYKTLPLTTKEEVRLMRTFLKAEAQQNEGALASLLLKCFPHASDSARATAVQMLLQSPDLRWATFRKVVILTELAVSSQTSC